MRCWAYSTSRCRAWLSRSISSERKYQKAATIAAMKRATETSGASAARRSWRVGERLRHQERHHCVGSALEKLLAVFVSVFFFLNKTMYAV